MINGLDLLAGARYSKEVIQFQPLGFISLSFQYRMKIDGGFDI